MAQADVFLSIGTEGFGIPVLEALQLGTPVVFSGVQPAAELMEGTGAKRVNDPAEAFAMSVQDVQQLQATIDTAAVPRWNDFSAAVATAVMQTLP